MRHIPGRLGGAGGRRKRRRAGRAAGIAFVSAAAVAAVGGCASGGPGSSARLLGSATPDPREPLDRRAEAWVEETLRELGPRERVAQLVMVWMSGGYASRSNEELRRIEDWVRDLAIGGVVISVGTPHGYASRLGRLQGEARTPLLVAADFEAGAGFRVGGVYALPSLISMGGATTFPPAMAFGAAGDPGLAYEAGRVTGLEARALGVHMAFAPVLDVNNNPANPIIATRSYGEEPRAVAELGAAYIRGARDAGLLTTAKHFPGHGDTETDSHLALPSIPGDRARLDRLELVPFRRAIAEGVDAIMTAHVAAPAIPESGGVPATLSPYFMTRVLREELGFEGLVFTDALDMGAIVEGYGAGEAAVRALEAGSDVLLMPPDPVAAVDAVVAAMESGRLDPARVEASVRRMLELKARAGLAAGRRVPADRLPGIVGIAEHAGLADSVARRALTLVRDYWGAVPLDTAAAGAVLSVTWAGARDLAAGRVFDRRLGERLDVRSSRIGPWAPPGDHAALAERAGSADLVVVSLYAAAGGELPPDVAAFLAEVDAGGTPSVVVLLGSPYALGSLPSAGSVLLAWGGGEAEQRAAADALLGRVPVGGRLPASLPPDHRIGEGLDRPPPYAPRETAATIAPAEVPPRQAGMDPAVLARLDHMLVEAVREGVTPGAALAVGRSGRLVRLRGYGRLAREETAPAVNDSTLFDLASLTKVVGTTTAIMRLVEEGRLGLDDRIGETLPEWDAGWKAEVTVRDLLLHRGGLPPFRPFWRELEGREAYREAIAGLEAEATPRTRTIYSDLGLVTLGFVVEAIAGAPLDRVLEDLVFGPLGMRDTGFRPPPPLRARAMPTEVDTLYRGRHLVGEVHDENAWALGGVAGHAGLFSSARDLARFADWILAAARAGRGMGDGRPLAVSSPSPGTVADFVAGAGPASSRALGWATPSGLSSAGRFFGPGAFGHTGFTGTSLWVDPELDLFVVLLTSRVNPTREERRHVPLRRAVHDAAAAAILDRPVEPRGAEGAPDGEGR